MTLDQSGLEHNSDSKTTSTQVWFSGKAPAEQAESSEVRLPRILEGWPQPRTYLQAQSAAPASGRWTALLCGAQS